MKYLFIDESGDHNLLPNKIDPTFPIFVLTGIIFDSNEYKRFQAELIKLKKRLFDNDRLVLHSLELTRTKSAKQHAFRRLADVTFRKEFYFALNQLIAKYTFNIAAFIIQKPWYAKNFGSAAPDPYFLSFSYIFSMFEEQLSKKEVGDVFVEQRNPILDKQFLLAWESAKLTRVGLVSKLKIDSHRIAKPNIIKKAHIYSGLELADLISYRIARNCLGKKEKPAGNEIDLQILNTKRILLSGLPDVFKKKETRISSSPIGK